ncbi:hypothetical protein BDQ12DRAFT_403949 [Crucibulum laeve]|uniref:Uncharacterized protein n=1 Tax=Crucibulum laeve TaxID=68775 RepID=A0A5C3LLW3_9AGAR|nr:hypothetical protein BDQ12DRAFT_403949 [Crucibulum laeve]
MKKNLKPFSVSYPLKSSLSQTVWRGSSTESSPPPLTSSCTPSAIRIIRCYVVAGLADELYSCPHHVKSASLASMDWRLTHNIQDYQYQHQ